MSNYSVKSADLREIARKLRVESLRMIYKAGSGHPGGSLSAAEIVAVLYWRMMKVRPKEPRWPDRDRLVFSKGHACPVLYAALCLKGFFKRAHLDTLRGFETILQGHPSMKHTPGLDMSTGSLGQGLSAACGMALGAKHQGKDFRVYCVMSDGEQDEGLTWEAAMFARHYELGNLTAILDFNGLQLDGYNKDIMRLDPLSDKWRAFGWNVIACDGHDVDSLTGAIEKAHGHTRGPSIIIARTVKGRGVSYMEDVCVWHGKVPNKDQFDQAMKELGG